MKIIEFFVIEDNEFDKLVENSLGQKYSFANDMESENDMDHVFMDIGNNPIYRWEKEDVERFKTCGEGSFLARAILKHLVKIGKLKIGNYLIRVMW